MIDFQAIASAIVEAATEALYAGAYLVEQRAKARAPVRNIFGFQYSFRQKRVEEYGNLAEVPTKTLEGALTGGPFSKTVDWEKYSSGGKRKGKLSYERQWEQRRTKHASSVLLGLYDQEMAERRLGKSPAPTTLSRSGAYEVRSKRAEYSTWGHSHIGGRLRGEISVVRESTSASGAELWVISPTPYAKYQEYGTRHNRAHPFLRPAAEESRETVVNFIAAAVEEASRQGGGSTEVEIVVRL